MEELKILEENLSKDEKSKDTIKKYKSIIRKFVQSNENVFDYADKMKYRDEVSHFKSALKEVYNIKDSQIKKLEEIHDKKKKRRRKIREQTQLRSVWRSVNAIRNKKLKLVFRLSFVSGLRIKELSELKKQDLFFDDKEKRIIVHVEKGKGNKSRDLWTIMGDDYLFENLKEFVQDLDEKERLFYSRSYLHAMAKKYNFQNHDLRANVLQVLYYSGNDIETCQDYLGHSKGSKTYLYYKNRKINPNGTKFDV